MRAYSEDLRRKIVEAIERGMPRAQAAHLFSVSLSSVKRYVRIVKQGRSLAPKKVPGRPPKIGEDVQKLLEEDIKERPAATIADRRRFLECLTNNHLSDSTVSGGSSNVSASAEKRSTEAMERDEWLRAAWRVMVAGQIDPKRLVFVDEMGTNTSLSPLYAWAPKGERARCSVPRNRGPNTTLLASIAVEGMGPCLAVEGPSVPWFSRRTSRRCSPLLCGVGT